MIPRTIYQTWKTSDDSQWTFLERRLAATWRSLKGYRYEMHDDAACQRLVDDFYPECRAAYASFTPVEKADFWRVLVLHQHGGVYADFDTRCRVHPNRWLLPDDELVLGIMCDDAEKYADWKPRRRLKSGGAFDTGCAWVDQPTMFTNWAFASAPGHPLLAEITRRIIINSTDPYFLDENPGWVPKKTGPGVVSDALGDYLEEQGTSLNDVAVELRSEKAVRVGNVRLLDFAAFHSEFLLHLGTRHWERRRGLDRVLNHVEYVALALTARRPKD